MSEVKAIVLRAAGINCDMETHYTLELAGARTERVHINSIIENKTLLDNYQILVFPGGFSYGDDVAAGKILANQVKHHLADTIAKFLEAGKLALGICNGFQVLVKAGILPGNGQSGNSQNVTITNNDSGKFEDRWVYLEPQTDKCVFIEPGLRIYLPIAHAEGKVVAGDDVIAGLKDNDQIAFKYVDKDGNTGDFPINPNGSIDSIAGLTDSSGRVLGLMPHPERFIRRTQHPHFTRMPKDLTGHGMTIFNNAVKYVKQNL